MFVTSQVLKKLSLTKEREKNLFWEICCSDDVNMSSIDFNSLTLLAVCIMPYTEWLIVRGLLCLYLLFSLQFHVNALRLEDLPRL